MLPLEELLVPVLESLIYRLCPAVKSSIYLCVLILVECLGSPNTS